MQKYLYETNHIIATLEILASATFLDKLQLNIQKVIQDALQGCCRQGLGSVAASVDKDRQYLKGKGMTVTPCSAEDQQIIDMIKPLTDKLYRQAWAKPLTDKIRAVK